MKHSCLNCLNRIDGMCCLSASFYNGKCEWFEGEFMISEFFEINGSKYQVEYASNDLYAKVYKEENRTYVYCGKFLYTKEVELKELLMNFLGRE